MVGVVQWFAHQLVELKMGVRFSSPTPCQKLPNILLYQNRVLEARCFVLLKDMSRVVMNIIDFLTKVQSQKTYLSILLFGRAAEATLSLSLAEIQVKE